MRKKQKRIYESLFLLGHMTGCHQLPERSFIIKGRQFPLCARCTGLLVGYLVGLLLLVIGVYTPVPVCILLASLMYADWKVQQRGICESTNLRRFVTGTGCGIGYMHVLFCAFTWLLSRIGL